MRNDSLGPNPIWDEHRWESHLNDIEQRSEQLRRFITTDPNRSLPRWMSLMEDHDSPDAVDTFIEEELLLDEAYFPDDDEEWDDEDDDIDDDDVFFQDDAGFDGASDGFFADSEEDDGAEDDFDHGEEWKMLSEDYTLSDYGSLENLEVYQRSRLLTIGILDWADSLDESALAQPVHDLVETCLRVTAKLAGGFSCGFDHDYLGGNIAYTKKALEAANAALVLLQSLKPAGLLTPSAYATLHGELFEVRNDIGVYVQQLRERFRFGVE